MLKVFKNIFFIFSAVLILLPSAVSFTHLFSEHSHKLCDNNAEHHYHAKSVDCELHHFQKNPALRIDFPEFQLVIVDFQEKLTFDYYRFLNDFEALAFDLRGPPAIA
ncbi:hypothetical protein [Christiangramia sabulilitoris]|uniref:Uncharacterized protein n=1 Tax=Christiangramia sabulilitoris TaxID=2583991 RepID=A0A550I6J3_9FLAO|nr:hypothetical protein [Christiangramia sabulilitoris]TRO66596.1 hypothetical protein FGM01_01555 [Christiangramia sabulilitoris]